MRIKDILTGGEIQLTPAEAKIAQVMLAEYPTSALGTATALAKRAGVSDPTVIRLVTKMGFAGFASFHSKLLEEVEAGLRSPLMMMEAKRPASKGRRGVAEAYMHSVAQAVAGNANATLPQLYDRAVHTIMEAKGDVIVLGGRFSKFVSGMFASYLKQFRPNVVSIDILAAETFDILIDLSKRDVLIVFDFRRYQRDVIRFAEQAAKRGVQIVLFTDPYRSPIANKAKLIIVSRNDVESPYDSLCPPVAQIEALIAHIVADGARIKRRRVQELEKVRTENAVTVDSSGNESRLSFGKRRKAKVPSYTAS